MIFYGDDFPSYENRISYDTDYDRGDDCVDCEYKEYRCNNQCMKIHVVCNPNLR